MSTVRDPGGPFPWRLWLAVAAPPALWYGEQQAVTTLTKIACGAAGPPLTPVAGAIALILCLACAAVAGAILRADRGRFLAWLALGSAAIFALAIAFQTLAELLLPPCVR